ncbi:hypothetical protein LABALGLTS371_07550 [Dellaglioa algida]|uniref:Type I restriction modification DNA specificity domain-containing protein n=1 Tax=Dellaglioa algida TaxID=105612 RepID=A0A5C6M8W8_9LACO|nr:restriction endonuclease subunit S [Dellaglioa algida]MDK1717072.1 restriction endonuclease subunit S [Dellaglioa algida]MDK1719858.1 restriction endonuclease subunit S [Dellaglioa algida]MDK1722014.1 restriction endonuclease subunit S [Dellaglioa algida]TWW11240.1 hypothetical protein LABALGLTS371_07550 [Dellaglioa algida]
MSEKMTPEIRFRGFSDDWEQRKLGDLNKTVRSYSLTRDVETSDITNLRYIHYGDIHKKIANFINAETKLPNIKDGIYEPLSKGDVVVADASEDYLGIAEPSILLIVPSDKIVAGLHTIAIRPTKMSSLYLYYLLHTTDFKRFGSRVGTGLKVFGITKVNLLKYETRFPKLKEQVKIGELLKKIDSTIALHLFKLETLKKLKQGYLQVVFPENKYSIPYLRFANFSAPWEQRKLGDLGSVAMNKRIFKEQTSEFGDIPFFKIGTFGGNPDAFISRKLYDEYKTKYAYPKIGDILISASGSIGKMVEYQGKDEYFQDSNIIWFKHDNRINNKFLKQFYLIVKWQGLEGSTIKRLYNRNVLSTIINIPSSLEEQKIVSTFLERLDNTIALHQAKIEKLQRIKKSYLQKMFI